MQRTATIAVLLSALVLLIIFGVYFVLKGLQQQTLLSSRDPYTYIPVNANVVFHIRKPLLFLEAVTQTGPMASDLARVIAHSSLYDQLREADSLVRADADLSGLLANSSILLSLHGEPQQHRMLYQVIMTDRSKVQPLAEKLNSTWLKDYHTETIEIAGASAVKILPDEESDTSVWYYIQQGQSLLFSKERDLLGAAIASSDEHHDKNIFHHEGFERLRNSAGRFADNLYVHTPFLCELTEHWFSDENPLGIQCHNFTGWQMWDLSYHTGELIFNGFAEPGRSEGYFLSALNHQQPGDFGIASQIPYNPAWVFYLGLSDMETFGVEFSRVLQQQGEEGVLKGHLRRFGDVTDFDPDSLEYFRGKEFAMVVTPEAKEPVFVMSVDSIAALTEHPRLNVFFREKFLTVADDHLWQPSVFEVLVPGFFPVFSKGMITVDLPFMAVRDGYIMACASEETLSQYLESLRFGQTFSGSETASLLQNVLPDQHTTLLSFSAEAIQNTFLAAPGFAEFNQERENVLDNFGQISLQFFSGSSPLVFSNAMVTYQPDYSVSNPLRWETTLENQIHKGPFHVFNHNDNSPEIIVQDASDKLYLLDAGGAILWSKQISGPAMSRIYQVDIYKNGRYQYLFNTRNYLHLIDRNGDYVRGYPMRLPAPASAGLAVFDYEENKNYRVVFPSENRRIYNYSLGRRPVTGWVYERSENFVNRPLQHLRVDSKDFLFVVDTTGRLEILNRRGQSRIRTRQGVKAVPGLSIAAASQSDDPHFMIAGEKGKLHKLKLDGNFITLEPDSFSTDYHFIYEYFTDKQERDLIFWDQGILRVYDLLGQSRIVLPLAKESIIQPIYFEPSPGKRFLGLTDPQTRRIFLVNEAGKIEPPFPVAGDTGFYMHKNEDESFFVITGLGNRIRSYAIGF